MRQVEPYPVFRILCTRCGIRVVSEERPIYVGKETDKYYCSGCATIISHDDPFEDTIEYEREKRREE